MFVLERFLFLSEPPVYNFSKFLRSYMGQPHGATNTKTQKTPHKDHHLISSANYCASIKSTSVSL